ncbi:GTPase regulator Nrf1 [Paraconiothyrium brasiliense]|uniref:GTPase regulator Nrf1 n=1 Tax=Paraconiothyrium brasiliense TaxID=300254 RepID=A0ABR3QUV7_9PLEO
MSNVIIFGAAGAVASAAALEASSRGAKVWLSVRPSELSTLDQTPELSETKRYPRVVADLTDPSTVTQAIKTSGATTAFLYTVFACQDGMKTVFTALKDAGVTYVVLLSSYAVKDPSSSMQKTKGSAWHHAQAEIALESVGLDAAVLRPMYFCSNLFLVAGGAKCGVVELFRPETVFDFIVPGDIGAVAGGLLATREHKGVVILNGPELMTMRDAIQVTARASGRSVEIREIDEEAFRRNMSHLPEVDLQSLVANHVEYSTKLKEELFPKHGEAVENLQRFGGRVTKIADWAGGSELMSMIHNTYDP